MYWFCQISKWIRHRYTYVPHPEPSSLLPPHSIPLGRPSAPAPSIQYCALNLDWQLVSYLIFYKLLRLLFIFWKIFLFFSVFFFFFFNLFRIILFHFVFRWLPTIIFQIFVPCIFKARNTVAYIFKVRIFQGCIYLQYISKLKVCTLSGIKKEQSTRGD